MRADLHTHSNRSDGTGSPAQVVAEAAEAGLDVMALTDHDTAEGWDEAIETGERLGVRVLPGIEISTERDGASLHLLGFLLDPTSPELAAEMRLARQSRETRAQRMVDLIAVDYPLTWDHVLDEVEPGSTIGRPHIADALVRAGVFTHRDEAFAQVLHARSKYHVHHYAPDLATAVRAVRAAGGVPVVAHGLAQRQRKQLDEALLEELVEAGLLGLEVRHRDHDEAAQRQLLAWTSKYDLIATGGSDYHGTGKRNLLAENLTEPRELARIEAAARG